MLEEVSFLIYVMFCVVSHDISHDISEYVRMFVYLISISLAEPSYLVSNVWHVKIMV